MHVYAQATLGEISAEEADQLFLRMPGDARNARWITLTAQIAAEAFAFRGDLDAAMRHLSRSAEMVLVDLTWLDRCPLLAPLRPLPAFAEARRLVEARAAAIWIQ